MDGRAFTNSATPAARYIEFWLNEQNLAQLAAQVMMLQINDNSAELVKEPLMLGMAALVSESTYVQGFVDQILGTHLGEAVNDVSTELVGGTINPENAIAMLQEA